MPFVKPISGHTKIGSAQRYLEKEDRALARDFLNLDAPMAGIDEDGLPEYREYDWASIMDETREKLGNDSPFKGRKARTYKHYVFSPDPRDAVSLSELRSVTMTWVEENFGDYEVAVVYHDDNEHHIPHAHVVRHETTGSARYARLRPQGGKPGREVLQHVEPSQCRGIGLRCRP